MKNMADQSVVVERVDDGDKEKKKKRRSNRRSKQNENEKADGGSQLGSNGKEEILTSSTNSSSSIKQGMVNMHISNQERYTTASNVSFTSSSMPLMHTNEQKHSTEARNIQHDHCNPSKISIRILSRPRPEAIAHGAHVQTKIFPPHWSMEAVNEAVEGGHAFKALFHVNAHNRLEAYCKVDGLPVDVLVSGIAYQNRAVEGDIVVVKVDNLQMWTKMKGGSIVPLNKFGPEEDVKLLPRVNEMVGNSKGKNKVDVEYEDAHHESSIPREKESLHVDNSIDGMSCQYSNGHNSSAVDSLHDSFSNGKNERISGLERLSVTISSCPSKRPTGRVVAIIEGSPRRDLVVGFLNIKQFLFHLEGIKKEIKKNLLISDHEFIQLSPIDQKFPKMMVSIRSFPSLLTMRLEKGDLTVEKELVGACIDSWSEDSPFPCARISHIFGLGDIMESQLNAILCANAICCSDFSPESLSGIPHILPWEIPHEELKNRMDFRDWCIFTIDPRSATDLDDALSVNRLSTGILRVGVHIADVSYFVLPDTALDVEAQTRSTSVYMPQNKIPMLPSVLSENLGSLNPGVDRLAFSIVWDFNGDGDVVDRWIGRSVIRSCCKLSYENAQKIIEGSIDKGLQLFNNFKSVDVIESVKILHQVSIVLREKRINHGALRLENPKIKFLFDENGIPYDSMFSEMKDSNFLVEELMLLANRTVAEVISRAFPDSALLRRHPEPNMRKLKEFEVFWLKHGLELDTSSSGNFQRSLELIREKLKDDSVLLGILISYASKPMQLSSYFCTGDVKDNMDDWRHYGLCIPFYTHFTSPLRRYPDIVVHRTLAAVIEAEKMYPKKKGLHNVQPLRYFSGMNFDKGAAESIEGKQALSAAALMHGVPCTKLLADVATHCNKTKLACRHVKDACDKLCTWALLKKKKILFSEARVMGLGPRFMSIYICKLAIERRLYYDEVECLTVEWLEATSTLILDYTSKQSYRRSGYNSRTLHDVAYIVNPTDVELEMDTPQLQVEAAMFPLTVSLLSPIPVALHAVGGDDGPIDVGVRLYMTSYFK